MSKTMIDKILSGILMSLLIAVAILFSIDIPINPGEKNFVVLVLSVTFPILWFYIYTLTRYKKDW